jgi:hypothetical protein
MGTKVTDRPALHGIDGTQHTDPVTQVDRPMMTEVLLYSVLTTSGRGRRSAMEFDGDGNT